MTPDAADAFAVPADGDAFTPPSDDQAVALWTELRLLLDGLVARAATPADRDKANSILSRLGLAAELAPLMLIAVRESRELEAIVADGEGQSDKAERLRRGSSYVGNLAASTPEQNKSLAETRERLNQEWLVAYRLGESALRAARQLHHNRLWLWPLWTPDASPFPVEKDLMGNERRQNAGGSTNCLIGPKLQEVAGQMGLDCYKIDAWRTCVRAEPSPARRRYRSSGLSSPSPAMGLGVSPHSTRF